MVLLMLQYMVYTKMVDLFDSVPRPPGDLMSIGSLTRKTSKEPKGYVPWFQANKRDWEILNKGEVCASQVLPCQSLIAMEIHHLAGLLADHPGCLAR